MLTVIPCVTPLSCVNVRTHTLVLVDGGGDTLEDDGTLVKEAPVVQDVGVGQFVAVVLLPSARVQHSGKRSSSHSVHIYRLTLWRGECEFTVINFQQ